ncbi:MAG TPA: CarD family transcriptional regulator, partial [Solirubrobacterales bacterium]|nr:CarD family transcriptional regulator [Solirubrobacterales bacterium]
MAIRPLLQIATEDGDFRSLATAVRSSDGVGAHMSPAVRPFLLAALVEAEYGLADRPALVVTADDRSARDLARELGAYLKPRRVRYYPSRGTGYESHVAPPPHLVGLRIAALDALTGAEPDAVVVASAVALAEAVPDASLRPAGFALGPGDQVDLDEVAARLVEAGYERVDQVAERGQFAVRGGILDVFGATEDRAARAELFGDEIESVRWFSTFTQRSLGDAERVELAPAAELAAEHRAEEPSGKFASELAGEPDAKFASELGGDRRDERPDIAELLPTDRFQAPLELIGESTAVIVAAEEEIDSALSDHWDDVTIAMHAADARHLYVEVADPLRDRAVLSISGVESGQEHSFRAQRPASAARTMAEAEGELERELRSGYLAMVTFEHRGEAERARYNLTRLDAALLDGDPLPPAAGKAHADRRGALLFAEAALADGFVSPQLRLAVIPQRRLVHRRRPDTPPTARGRLASFTELGVGDHVVHEDHGIARFAGFETRSVAGVTRDYLQLEYRGEDRVFVPAEQLAKITRYVGTGGAPPQLSALGSKRWDGMKARARRAARDLAGELLNLYAERRARRGRAFPPDGEWQLTLERAFPYRETADQLAAVDAVKGDMEAVQPMDRLICGDVGYGKTEVALRAAHKAAA